jgi:hypothetical protein
MDNLVKLGRPLQDSNAARMIVLTDTGRSPCIGSASQIRSQSSRAA